ncbi:MAG: sulfite oxidase [Halieaceae bacterium]|nr:sulfite oxidase [Halieaceae bacterium]
MPSSKRERGLHELYREDPERAQALVFGRRSFLAGISAVLGAEVVFGRFMPAGLIPAALAESTEPFLIPGKDPGLVVLNDRPLNAETPPHLLDDPVTPADRLFVRNNGIPPLAVDASQWALTIGGESAKSVRRYTLADLKQRFKTHSYQLTLECGGNGRSEFNPPARGNQWTTGAVGCPRWTGVRLRDVLKDVGVKDDAVYIGYYGADTHLSGDPSKVVISRGVPIAKAMQKQSLIAWAINGEDMPIHNGHPLRLVFGGWPASTSGKWLTRISVRDREHDGPKMGGYSYRVPCEPVVPGAEVPEQDMCIIESMPVKSLVTYPRSGLVHRAGQDLELRGHAWAGDHSVSDVDISIDFGQTWRPARVRKPVNRLAWQQWSMKIEFPHKGYYEVWARATDSSGIMQPMVVPGWNPRGYLNNATHRIAVKVV